MREPSAHIKSRFDEDDNYKGIMSLLLLPIELIIVIFVKML